jgi:hypothetical protein
MESQLYTEFASDLVVTFGLFVDNYYDKQNSETEAQMSTGLETV